MANDGKAATKTGKKIPRGLRLGLHAQVYEYGTSKLRKRHVAAVDSMTLISDLLPEGRWGTREKKQREKKDACPPLQRSPATASESCL